MNDEVMAFLYCNRCEIPLQMTNNRGLYCPKCKKNNLGRPPKYILCCAECEKPLRVTNWVIPIKIKGWSEEQKGGYGAYCNHCNFHPSMQDTFLWKLSAMKSPT